MRQNTDCRGHTRRIKPENQKEWLESFTFEDIYFRRVPGAPSLEELSNDNLITIRRCRGYLMIVHL